MEVKNENHISAYIDKIPTLVTCGRNSHRGEDTIQLHIPNIEEYETDLIQNGDLFLNFTNEQAVAFAKQLIDCIVKDVDVEFMERFPGIPPF